MKKQIKKHCKLRMIRKCYKLLTLASALLILSNTSNLQAQTTCTGDVFLYSQADVDNFATTGCNIMLGSLRIEGTDITNLNGLSSLTSARNLYIYNCTALTNVDGLSSLTSVSHHMNIDGTELLTNIDGLSNLTSVGSNIAIARNASLTNVNGLLGITSVNSILGITDNGSLTNVDGLSNLTSAGTVIIDDNDVLNNIDGLSSLITLGEHTGVSLRIADNISLTEFCGLFPLFNEGTVAGSVSISGNAANPTVAEISAEGPCDLILTSQAEIDAFNYEELAGSLTIDELIDGDIINLNGLSELTAIGRDLTIISNDGLFNIDGLSNLSSVGGELEIRANPVLPNLDGLSSLTSITSNMEIVRNINLTNLDSLYSLINVGGDLQITSNTSLQLIGFCGLYNLFNTGGVTGGILITRNAPLDEFDIGKILDFGPCRPVYDGNLIITSQEEIDVFNYKEVTGNLTISESVSGNIVNLLGLYLGGPLTSIGGSLIISNNDMLSDLNGLTKITSVGSISILNNANLTEYCGLWSVLFNDGVLGSVTISGNSSNPTTEEILADGGCIGGDINLTNQSEVDNFNYIGVLGDLRINDLIDGNITNLDGLSELIWVRGQFEIESNIALTNIDGLSNLHTVWGRLYINDNQILNNINGLSNIYLVNNLFIWNNNALEKIVDLSNFKYSHLLWIADNYNLSEFCGLYPLLNAGRTDVEIRIGGNAVNPTKEQILADGPCIPVYNGDLILTSQAEIDAFEYTEVLGNLEISGTDIVNLYGLLILISVEGDLYIRNNPLLTNLDGLSSLSTVGGDVIIDNNPVLTDLDGLSVSSLTYIGQDLEILNNSSLTNLDGLSSLSYLGNNLRLIDNLVLTRFGGLYLLFESGGVGGTISISGNGLNPTTEEILQGGPCTAEDRILTLIDKIVQLVNTGILNQGQGNALIVKLNHALIKLDNGEINNAINILNGFVNQVSDFISEWILTLEQGQSLIATANDIVDLINNGLFKQGNDGTSSEIPAEFTLEQNYPNPFNPTTTIIYGLPEDSPVVLKIYDVLGAEIIKFTEEHKVAGYHRINFDASNLPSGIYFYKIQAGSFVETKKMVLMK
jgi:hypothetical protein